MKRQRVKGCNRERSVQQENHAQRIKPVAENEGYNKEIAVSILSCVYQDRNTYIQYIQCLT